MIEPLELRYLRYFVAVAEERHFGRAADRVGISQPPLSQQIQRLEELVGHALFRRRPRVELTEAGKVFLGVALRTLSQVEEGIEATRRAGRGETGAVSLGFPASVLVAGLPTALSRYRKAFPDVEVRMKELSTAEQIDKLIGGTLDIGILRETSRYGKLAIEVILEEPFVAVLPPRHRLTSNRLVKPSSLAGEPFVHFPREVAPGLHDRVLELCREAGFAPRIVQEAFEWITIVGLVEAGLGVSLVPESFQRLRWGKVKYKPLRATKLRTTIALAWRPNELPAAGQELVDVIRQSMSSPRD